ncbi:hypothetical protein [Limosilactobacillus portuensis]|uniref:hypothetical protein n=1 Tax=Limosilactobacillus portuensis TaxID=2742601 RepID=UPI003D73E093
MDNANGGNSVKNFKIDQVGAWSIFLYQDQVSLIDKRMVELMQHKTSLVENGMIWCGAGISIAEILTGTYLAPLGMVKGITAIMVAIMPSEYTDEIENSSMYSEGIFLWGENLNTPQKQSY